MYFNNRYTLIYPLVINTFIIYNIFGINNIIILSVNFNFYVKLITFNNHDYYGYQTHRVTQ